MCLGDLRLRAATGRRITGVKLKLLRPVEIALARGIAAAATLRRGDMPSILEVQVKTLDSYLGLGGTGRGAMHLGQRQG